VADLRQAIAKGYRNLQGMKTDDRFAPLRARGLQEAVGRSGGEGTGGKGGDRFDWFFLAMTHRKLGNDGQARKFFGMAVAWREKNKQALKDNKSQEDELRRFQTEAKEVLELKKK
jgi:hypothetical protein